MWLSLEGIGELAASAGKIVGFAGGAFTLARAFFSWAVDQSLERDINRTTGRIDESIGRLRKLDESKAQVEAMDFHAFSSQVRETLQTDLHHLQSISQEKKRREGKRNVIPKGARSWPLFFWPEGFDGWLAHSLFYGCAAVLAISGWAILRDGKPFSLKDMLAPAASYFVILLYLRWAAIRLKSVAILKRVGHLYRINEDLGVLQRTFLLFKPKGQWGPLIHIDYYFFVIGALAIPVLFLRIGGPGTVSKPFYWEISAILASMFLLGARVLAADALARRFLSTLSNARTSPTVASSGAAS